MTNETQQSWFGEGFKTELKQGGKVVITPNPIQRIQQFLRENRGEIAFQSREESLPFALVRYIPENTQLEHTYGLNWRMKKTSEVKLFSPLDRTELALLIEKLSGEFKEEDIRSKLEEFSNMMGDDEELRRFAKAHIQITALDNFVKTSKRYWDLYRSEDSVISLPASQNPFENRPIYRSKDASRGIIYGPNNMPLQEIRVSGDLIKRF
jgi:hypothetical protein